MSRALITDSEEQELLEYRWTPDRFLRAWEAGVFDEQRVELLDGKVFPVSIGDWHSETAVRLIELLPREGVRKSQATLASGESLPDPDVWVRRADAQPKAQLSKELKSWHAQDVLLVVEVSNSTTLTDLGFKAQLYGSSGYGEYWVVTKEKVYVHREPTSGGYRVRVEYRPGDQLPVPYSPGVVVPVGEVIAP